MMIGTRVRTALPIARTPFVLPMIGLLVLATVSVAGQDMSRAHGTAALARGLAPSANEPALPVSAQIDAGNSTMASKQTDGMTVLLTSKSGRLSEGKNSICVVFQTIKSGQPVDVSEVGIEFTLLVGRNRGRPISVQLSLDAAGRHCGNVDLGRQYYFPTNYDVVVRYVDAAAKKKKLGFWLSLR